MDQEWGASGGGDVENPGPGSGSDDGALSPDFTTEDSQNRSRSVDLRDLIE